jgi:hypothetical protein
LLVAPAWGVSLNGGSDPRWSPRGDELFHTQSNALLSAKVGVKGEFRSSPPEKLFDGASQRFRLGPGFAVLPDGKQFVVVQDEGKAASSIVIVENWLAEFQK